MIVAHLIGGNEIEGIDKGTVIINDEKLEFSYEELVSVCGNISLGDLDTSMSEERIKQSYIVLVEELDNENVEDSKDFVINNYLTKEVCYSTYKVDFENKTLELKIEIFG